MRAPSAEELRVIAEQEYIRLDDPQAQQYASMFTEIMAMVSSLDEIAVPRKSIPIGVRDSGYVPSNAEDPLNLFTRKCRITGDPDGPLLGKTFAVKDNIAVAGMPISNGSRQFAYVPDEDAAVVERILSAGGTLIGKLNMDDYGSGATGETSFYGPSRNPVDTRYSAGGSSCGAGAAVASGAVDFALGVDQGGSARIPASFCGVCALLPTHGLVPTHGVTHLDTTFDYVCPMASNVHDIALLLQSIAGPDSRDPQCVRGDAQVMEYSTVQPAALDEITLGIVTEACDPEICEADVLTRFQETVESLRQGGAKVLEVSIPLWRRAWPIELVLLLHVAGAMLKSEGAGYGHWGSIDIERVRAFAFSRRLEADSFPVFMKLWLIGERYLHERYFNVPYARAQNLRLHLRNELAAQFGECSVLMTPGTTITAPKLAEQQLEDSSFFNLNSDAVYNSCPLNLTGNPALVVPSGVNEAGLPTSVQLIGRHFDEGTVLSVGMAIETAQSHTSMTTRKRSSR